QNLSGRTGRGDTCFSAYITERKDKKIEEALLFASALVSLKMEKPGPFKGTRDEVEDYIKKFY
ncbi:MAG: ribokinase, partial [Candidatus Atribacteria bacterium]|nr:ribokinase [Candidatus Atribacteria bacterium]